MLPGVGGGRLVRNSAIRRETILHKYLRSTLRPSGLGSPARFSGSLQASRDPCETRLQTDSRKGRLKGGRSGKACTQISLGRFTNKVNRGRAIWAWLLSGRIYGAWEGAGTGVVQLGTTLSRLCYAFPTLPSLAESVIPRY